MKQDRSAAPSDDILALALLASLAIALWTRDETLTATATAAFALLVWGGGTQR